MAEETSNRIHTLPPIEAARWLSVDEGTIRALVQARYLSVVDGGIPLADVRAFQARNAEGGEGSALGNAAQATDLESLLDALDKRVDELSGKALEMFTRAIPEARQWSAPQRQSFLDQAKGRFGAILAVTSQGSEVDEALQEDLQEVGASAAWAGASLPHLLLVLRLSRDLLLRTTLQIAEEGQGRWNAAMAAFSVLLLPTIDRLTDAISTGFWSANVARYQEESERLVTLMENIPYGIYEADIDGLIQYANPAMAIIAGRAGAQLFDMPLSELFQPIGTSMDQLLAEPAAGVAHIKMVIKTSEGTEEPIEIDTVVRRENNHAVGFAGIVRVVGAEEVAVPAAVAASSAVSVDLTPLVRHVYELRRSIEILTDAGDFIADHASDMTKEELTHAGDSVQRQAARLLVIVDEFDADRKALQKPRL